MKAGEEDEGCRRSSVSLEQERRVRLDYFLIRERWQRKGTNQIPETHRTLSLALSLPKRSIPST